MLKLGHVHTLFCIEMNLDTEQCTSANGDIRLQTSARSSLNVRGPHLSAEPCYGQSVHPLCKIQKGNMYWPKS